ncbi:helix-turn-helix domain-containing protein [Streptococcus suis]|uniref:helix-turn-helix domain-containing protein n=1 Tax=Streptococcus suis TaxID=1307 RepID=UPI000C1A1F92|nr:helix-turn-helix transcriptional regulator [Streptococcus suis]
MVKIGERLRSLRIDNSKSKQELSIYLDITESSYNRYEQGTRQPDIESLIKLAIFYNVSLDYLLGRDDIEMPVFEREKVLSYKDLVDLGLNGKFAHGIISEIDKSKPFEKRIRSSLDDKTKYVTKEEVRAYLEKVYDMI